MRRSAHQGTLLLSLAQVWHALAGYVIFITGARILGREVYGDFALVVWTLTTLEIFVVDGVPRAVSYYTARAERSAAAILLRGLWLTTAAAVGVAVLLVALADPIAALWKSPALASAVRLSALDFVAFVGFAVVTQCINGLHRFGLQAAVWLIYSTAKVAAVVTFLALGWGIEGGVLGYVVGSLIGSAAAWLAGRPVISEYDGGSAPAPATYWRYGLPVATQALAMMALVNVDLWAAKRWSEDALAVGAYAAAATLARVLFFVFKAFGDALFPAVARLLGEGDGAGATRSARQGLGLLCCLLLPATGLATGAAQPVLTVVFGESYGEAGVFLELLAPAATAWTFTAVLCLVIAAAARPWIVATLLVSLLAVEILVVFSWSATEGPLGAARGSLSAAVGGALISGAVATRVLGSVIPWRRLIVAGIGALLLDRALRLWCPPGWWVFPYGALLACVLLGAWMACGLLAVPRRPQASGAR